MNERVKEDKAKGRKSEKTINREVTQVLTKGTVSLPENEKIYLPNYLISIQIHGDCYGFSLL